MTAMTLLVILGASLAWSLLDALRKALASRMTASAVVVWLSLGQGLCFAAWALLAPGGLRVDAGYAAPGLSAAAIGVGASWLFVRALAASPLTLTIPLLSLTPVFAAFVEWAWLGARPHAAQWLGMGAVVAGALLLGAARGDLLHALRTQRGSVMMIGVAALWSISGVIDKLALAHAALPVHASAVALAGVVGLGPPALLAARDGRAWAPPRGRARALLAAAVLFACAALALQLVAYQLTLVGVVEAIKRGVGLLMAAALGRAVFGEPVRVRTLLAMALMGGGVALVVLG